MSYIEVLLPLVGRIPGFEHTHIIIGAVDKGKDDFGKLIDIVVRYDSVCNGLCQFRFEDPVKVQQVLLKTVIEVLVPIDKGITAVEDPIVKILVPFPGEEILNEIFKIFSGMYRDLIVFY